MVSILRYVAGRLEWTVNGPVRVSAIGGLNQYSIHFQLGSDYEFIVYGEVLPFFAAKVSAYLHALREIELIGFQIVDLHHEEYMARLEN